MKVRVKIAGKIFDVEIDSLHTQPVIARVDGEPIEVWLESAPSISIPVEKPGLEETAAVADKQIEIRAPFLERLLLWASKRATRCRTGRSCAFWTR